MSSNLPIGNGMPPQKGDRVKAKHIADLAERIKRLSRRVNVDSHIATKYIDLPFDPSVRIKAGTSSPYEYQISAARGLVIEKVSTAADTVDALLYWTPSNALTSGEPTWFNINSGQSLFVKVTEVNTGTVRVISSVILEVASSTTISTAYIPSVQDGIYYYEIAKFTIVDDMPVIQKWTTGNHIYHEVTTTGWWGTILNEFFTNITDSTPYTAIQEKFESGVLVEVKYQEPGGSLTTIAGTKDAPATVNFATFATP